MSTWPVNVKGLAWTITRAPSFETVVQSAPDKTEVRIARSVNPIWHWTFTYEFLFDDSPLSANTKAYTPLTDLQKLMGFFTAQQGQGGSFLYTDPDDNSMGPALVGSDPNTSAILPVVEDGLGNYYSPVQRNLGGFLEDITELTSVPIVYANAAPMYSPADYQLLGPGLAIPGFSCMGMYLAWAGPLSWGAGHSYTTDEEILDPAGHIQKAAPGGTSGSTIPTFNDAGGTTADGPDTLVWEDQYYNPGPDQPVTAEFTFAFRVRFEDDQQDFEKFMNELWTIGGPESRGGGAIRLMSARPT